MSSCCKPKKDPCCPEEKAKEKKKESCCPEEKAEKKEAKKKSCCG
jgi:hypothetical protein